MLDMQVDVRSAEAGAVEVPAGSEGPECGRCRAGLPGFHPCIQRLHFHILHSHLLSCTTLGRCILPWTLPASVKRDAAHTTGPGSSGRSCLARSTFDRSGVLQEVMGRALCGASPELLRDLSVHVCFICLLHLANEISLRISSVPSLDRLTAGNRDPDDLLGCM